MSTAKLPHTLILFALAGERLLKHGLRIVTLESANLKDVLIFARTSTMHRFPCRMFSLVILCKLNFGDISKLMYTFGHTVNLMLHTNYKLLASDVFSFLSCLSENSKSANFFNLNVEDLKLRALASSESIECRQQYIASRF